MEKRKEDYTCGICKLNGRCKTQKKDGRKHGCETLWEECGVKLGEKVNERVDS
jgi:hypothetical protein